MVVVMGVQPAMALAFLTGFWLSNSACRARTVHLLRNLLVIVCTSLIVKVCRQDLTSFVML